MGITSDSGQQWNVIFSDILSTFQVAELKKDTSGAAAPPADDEEACSSSDHEEKKNMMKEAAASSSSCSLSLPEDQPGFTSASQIYSVSCESVLRVTTVKSQQRARQ